MNSVGTMFYRRRSVFFRVWLNSKTFNHAAFLTHANHAIHAKMSTHATHAKILWTHAKISTHATHAKILRTHATHATHAKIWPTPRTHARHPRYLADSSGSWHRCFAVNIAKFLEHFFMEHLLWLPLVKIAKFQFQLFSTALDTMGSLYIVTK